ncbi:hypothetical protein ACFOZ0_18680 [Streptomyces yaanensis]|uniref:Uncharacterized protein n=1 Tax=Streptomyces yaanensis TaxID=1142239 RepID=A0ABV7SGG8_9ACTN|nr:hypothetical protein [Streptomyces sp. CGMCC 4.7035]WNB98098.1 hypothetical protein Q2K21_08415 [Streptomyces sp. CGMCC 4.7035]
MKVRPGDTVDLTLRNCTDPSQGGRAQGSLVGGNTTARSPIENTELTPSVNAGEAATLEGVASISSNAKPGNNETIYFVCNSNPDKVVDVPVFIAPD